MADKDLKAILARAKAYNDAQEMESLNRDSHVPPLTPGDVNRFTEKLFEKTQPQIKVLEKAELAQLAFFHAHKDRDNPGLGDELMAHKFEAQTALYEASEAAIKALEVFTKGNSRIGSATETHIRTAIGVEAEKQVYGHPLTLQDVQPPSGTPLRPRADKQVKI